MQAGGEAGEQQKGPTHRDYGNCHGAEPESQNNRSEPRVGGMQKDQTGMMLTLQFQTDSSVWEHSAAFFKGDGQGKVPSVWATSTPGCCSGDVAPKQVPSPAAVSGGSSCLSLRCVLGAGARLGGGFAATNLGYAEVLGDAAPSWAGTSGSPPCSRHHLFRVLWLEGLEQPITSRCSSDVLAATLGSGAAGMQVGDPQLGWFGANPQGPCPWLMYGE